MMTASQKDTKNGNYADDYMRIPVEKTKWESFRDVIYNPKEHTCLGKTRKQWGVTGLFYLVFFSGLTVFCALCYHGLMATIDLEKPRWTLDSSLIGTNPGLGFRPQPRLPEKKSLIWYNASNAVEVQDWVSNTNQFLEYYINSSKLPNGGRNQQVCSYQHPVVQEGNVCAVDVEKWHPCTRQNHYGFNNSSPCVFIKLNRIFDWVPAYYNETKNLPKDMPTELVNKIKKMSGNELNTVWVSCQGAEPFDRENIGKIHYFPESQGFAGYYYPYQNIPGYLSPLVAVYFERPKRNVIIAVECRAWAKNIIYDTVEKFGMVHFELLID